MCPYYNIEIMSCATPIYYLSWYKRHCIEGPEQFLVNAIETVFDPEYHELVDATLIDLYPVRANKYTQGLPPKFLIRTTKGTFIAKCGKFPLESTMIGVPVLVPLLPIYCRWYTKDGTAIFNEEHYPEMLEYLYTRNCVKHLGTGKRFYFCIKDRYNPIRNRATGFEEVRAIIPYHEGKLDIYLIKKYYLGEVKKETLKEMLDMAKGLQRMLLPEDPPYYC